jgi:hypothetical protein
LYTAGARTAVSIISKAHRITAISRVADTHAAKRRMPVAGVNPENTEWGIHELGIKVSHVLYPRE